MLFLFRNLLLLSAAFLHSFAFAADFGKASVVPGAYIVEFADHRSSDENSHLNTFYTHLSEQNIPATSRLNLSYSLFNGASFHLRETDEQKQKQTIRKITSLDSVKNIYPLRRRSLPYNIDAADYGTFSAGDRRQHKRAASDTLSTHVMTGVDKLRAEGLTGDGVNIAIVDSGVDYTHPALGGCFGPGCKVSYGYDLVGDDYTGMEDPNPDPDPFDGCVGHGTHVAGIIAADGSEYGFSGVAPNVTLGMFRVLGCAGLTADDILIEAFVMAYESGADVITASIGGSSGWDEDPWAIVVSKIVEAGVPCTLAAGNQGDYGLFYASSAADGTGVTAVASVDNVESPMLLIPGTYTANSITNSYGWVPGLPSNISSGTYPLYALTYNTTSTEDGCSRLPPDTPDLSEHIVLIQRGGCPFFEKALNAVSHGARHLLFYNNGPGAISIDVPVDGVESAGFVNGEHGKTWVALLSAGYDVLLDVTDPKDATMDLQTPANSRTGGHPSVFTSWGPTFEGQVKPQVGAPGGSILSTYPLKMGGYAILSGTSMSTPFVAGSIALVMEARGNLNPATIESLLSATANPSVFNDGRNNYKYLAPVAQQGAGLIDVHKAVYSDTFLSVSSISFNDTDHLVGSADFAIQNNGSTAVTYRLGYAPGVTVYALPADGSSDPDSFTDGNPPDTTTQSARLSFNAKTVSVESGQSVTVHVKPTVPSSELVASRIPVYGGYITLNGTNGDSLSLPYLGIASSLHNASILGTGDDRVYLSSISVSSYKARPSTSPSTGKSYAPPVKSGSTFTLPSPLSGGIRRKTNTTTSSSNNSTLPALVAQFSMGSPLVRVDVQPIDLRYNNSSIDNNNNKTTIVLGQKILGSIYGFPQRYMPRDAMVVSWEGQLSDGSFVPAGRYKLMVSALKIFGDATREEDYERAETVSFGIEYEK